MDQVVDRVDTREGGGDLSISAKVGRVDLRRLGNAAFECLRPSNKTANRNALFFEGTKQPPPDVAGGPGQRDDARRLCRWKFVEREGICHGSKHCSVDRPVWRDQTRRASPVATDRADLHLGAGAADNQNVRTLIETVGADRFASACDWAWSTAAGCGLENEPEEIALDIPGDPARVPHEIAEHLWFGSDTDLGECLHLALDVYDRMPCYATLSYIRHFAAQFEAADLGMVWNSYRRWLEGPDDRLADPVAYSLVKDFFPSREFVAEAWRALSTLEQPRVRRLKRLLRISGPVPYRLKAELYARLMNDPRWHPSILESLKSRSDIDAAEAEEILGKLCFSDDAPELDPTRERLLER